MISFLISGSVLSALQYLNLVEENNFFGLTNNVVEPFKFENFHVCPEELNPIESLDDIIEKKSFIASSVCASGLASCGSIALSDMGTQFIKE